MPGALTRNIHQRFECGDWFVKVDGEGPFTRASAVWKLPIAHGEGRYQADAETLERLEGEGLIGLRYCTARRRDRGAREPQRQPPRDRGHLRRAAKNVFGLMPHPERMSEALLGGADGRKLFDAVLAAA